MASIHDYILRVRAGPSMDKLITVNVNDENNPIIIDSENYVGYLIVRMQEFNGITPDIETPGAGPSTVDHKPIHRPSSEYFKGRNRKYSIVTQGKFKKEWNGDDIIFGVDMDIPLRAPIGTSMAINIAKWLDPSIQADISCPKPYMFSPYVSAMNSLAVYHPDNEKLQNKSPNTNNVRIISSSTPKSLEEYEKELQKWSFHSSNIPDDTKLLWKTESGHKGGDAYDKRKKIFSHLEKRQEVSLTTDLIYCADFYDAYIDFNQFSVKIPGFSLSCFKYWDKQPIKYSAVTKDRKTVLFIVMFEFIERKNVAYLQQ